MLQLPLQEESARGHADRGGGHIEEVGKFIKGHSPAKTCLVVLCIVIIVILLGCVLVLLDMT